MLLALVLMQSSTSQDILEKVREKVARADTITVTVTQFIEEHPKPVKTKWWFRKGGYYRFESPTSTIVASPSKCCSFKPTGKGYMEFPGAQTDWSLSRETGLGGIGDPTTMPPIGEPEMVKWHGQQALRIELDGTKAMTKETKLYYFFDPETHDPIGIAANLGSLTQVTQFTDLKFNPKIEESVFRFVPPKGWKLLKGF